MPQLRSFCLGLVAAVLLVAGCAGAAPASLPATQTPQTTAPTAGPTALPPAAPTAIPSTAAPATAPTVAPTLAPSATAVSGDLVVMPLKQFHGQPTPWDGPLSIALGPAGHLYLAEGGTNRVLLLDAAGQQLQAWGGQGAGDGQFQFAKSSAGLAVDGQGNVYVADNLNYRIQKFDASGRFLLRWGSQGTGDNQFNAPSAVAVDPAGHVYVADAGGLVDASGARPGDRILKFDGNGKLLAKFGSAGSKDGQFDEPADLQTDAQGNLFVADWANGRVQKFDPSGKFVTQWDTCGSGQHAAFAPAGVALDSAGNVYVADFENYRVCIYDNDGRFLGRFGSQGDGPAQFEGPSDVAVDATGVVYVADYINNDVKLFTVSGIALPAATHAAPTATVAPTLAAKPQVSKPMPPNATFDGGVSVDQLLKAGLTRKDACENAGSFTLSLSGNRYTFTQFGEPGCVVQDPLITGSWKLTGNQAIFDDDDGGGCSRTYTYGYSFDGHVLRFIAMDDACTERVLYLTLEPWVLEK